MSTINVNGAAARLLATGPLAKARLCLHYCWLAISQGKVHYITGGTDTAYNTWLAVPADERHSSRTVPKDFPAFLGKKFLSAAGDVIISNGDGTFVATDWPKSKQVGVCTLEQREKQTGRKFVGWASSMGGYELESTTTAGSGTLITEQDDIMSKDLLIRNSDTGAVVFANLAAGMWIGLAQGYPELLQRQGFIEQADGTVKPNVNCPTNEFEYFHSIATRSAANAAPAAGPTAAQIAAELVKLIPKVPTKFTGSLS